MDLTTSPNLSLATKVLKNELLLAKIAPNLPRKEILTLRKTCTLWNRCFRLQLQTGQVQVQLYNPHPQGTTVPQFVTRTRSFVDFIRSTPTGTTIPCWRYKIPAPICISTGEERAEEALLGLDEFFSVGGHFIRFLSVDIDPYSYRDRPLIDLDVVRRIVFELAPQLEELELGFRPEYEGPVNLSSIGLKMPMGNLSKLRKLRLNAREQGSEALSKLLTDLVKSAPGLQTLDLEADEAINLRVLRGSIHLDKLNRLTIGELTFSVMEAVVPLGLRLQEFVATLQFRDEGAGAAAARFQEIPEVLYKFLCSQAATLRVLKFRAVAEMPGNGVPLRLRLPRMEHLRSFGMERIVSYQLSLQLDDHTLGGNFPLLRRLKYIYETGGSIDTRTWLEDQAWIAHEGVDDLEVDLAYEDGILTQFKRLLPAVTKLKLRLELDSMNLGLEVWTNWPNLVSLHLLERQGNLMGRSSHSLDQLLSGIPSEWHGDLSKEMESSSGSGSLIDLGKMLEKFKTLPGLSQLRHLQRFILDCREEPYILTDIGGYFGLAMASPALWYLSLKSSSSSMSAECLLAVRKALDPHAIVNFNGISD